MASLIEPEFKQSGTALRPISAELIETGRIFPDPNNPRQHPRNQIRAIARSIQAFGFNAPILIDRHGRIVCGAGRWEAATFLGLLQVPVIRLEHLSEPQAKAYMLADNKLTDRSTWDETRLAVHLKDLRGMVLDFEIEATGFETPEIDLLIQSLEPGEEGDAADEFEMPAGPPVSMAGDVWALGPHRVMCANSLEPQTYTVLLGEEQAGCVFADPPYNVRINGHAGGKGRKKHREFAMASGEMTSEQFQDFLAGAFERFLAHLAPGGVSFVCMDWRHIPEILTAITRNGCEMLNLCVWEKTNGGMGSLYRSAHELVFVVRRQDEQSRNNVQLGRFGRNRTNVWHYAGMNTFQPQGQARALGMHPTVKPLALVMDALLDVSERGDIVLDPFMGSGTTILAAERTGRRGFGIELDPVYVDVAIRRWQRMTGEQATAPDGRTFAEIAAERGGPDEEE